MRVFAYLVGVSLAIAAVLIGGGALMSPNLGGTSSVAALILKIREPIALRVLSFIARNERRGEQVRPPAVAEQKKPRHQPNLRLTHSSSM